MTVVNILFLIREESYQRKNDCTLADFITTKKMVYFSLRLFGCYPLGSSFGRFEQQEDTALTHKSNADVVKGMQFLFSTISNNRFQHNISNSQLCFFSFVLYYQRIFSFNSN